MDGAKHLVDGWGGERRVISANARASSYTKFIQLMHHLVSHFKCPLDGFVKWAIFFACLWQSTTRSPAAPFAIDGVWRVWTDCERPGHTPHTLIYICTILGCRLQVIHEAESRNLVPIMWYRTVLLMDQLDEIVLEQRLQEEYEEVCVCGKGPSNTGTVGGWISLALSAAHFTCGFGFPSRSPNPPPPRPLHSSSTDSPATFKSVAAIRSRLPFSPSE